MHSAASASRTTGASPMAERENHFPLDSETEVLRPRVLFRQFVDDDLGCASYLIGDEDAGVVAVVDPAFSIEQYLAEAEQRACG